ncbi:hypothetical protein A0J61_11334 [Choanephora cucurbitarum]|uniref:Uncharacterized protein n=1 Tax=Choanephora cucurbitarum TaxID=101091 RepID=A0A1C7MV30_9FUNG|nr:hypothetical protein A0J61_11334 [Choanephora cucurbitarum]
MAQKADMDSFPGTGGNHMRFFYNEQLPKYVLSQYTIYVLRHKEAYWKTFLQRSYTKLPLKTKRVTTGLGEKQVLTLSTTDYFEYLVLISVEQGGISLENRPTDIQNMNLEATQVELEVMLSSVNASQKDLFKSVIGELTTNTTTF